MVLFILDSLFSPMEKISAAKEEKHSQWFLSSLFLVVSFVITYGALTIFLGRNVLTISLVQLLVFTAIGTVLSYCKIFLYTFFLEQKKQEFISYINVLYCCIVANIRLMVIILLLSLLSPFVEQGSLIMITLVVLGYSLKLKNTLIQTAFNTRFSFIYWISFVQWMFIIPIFSFIILKLLMVSMIGMFGLFFS